MVTVVLSFCSILYNLHKVCNWRIVIEFKIQAALTTDFEFFDLILLKRENNICSAHVIKIIKRKKEIAELSGDMNKSSDDKFN